MGCVASKPVNNIDPVKDKQQHESAPIQQSTIDTANDITESIESPLPSITSPVDKPMDTDKNSNNSSVIHTHHEHNDVAHTQQTVLDDAPVNISSADDDIPMDSKSYESLDYTVSTAVSSTQIAAVLQMSQSATVLDHSIRQSSDQPIRLLSCADEDTVDSSYYNNPTNDPSIAKKLARRAELKLQRKTERIEQKQRMTNAITSLTNESLYTYMSGTEPCIIDTGAYTIKSGYIYDSEPSYICHTVLGKPKQSSNTQRVILSSANSNTSRSDMYIGSDVYQKRTLLNVVQPFDNTGNIISWNDLDSIWSHIINKLDCDVTQHSLLLTTPVYTNNAIHQQTQQKDRQTITQLLYENHQCNNIYLISPAVLALQYHRKSTGIVIDIGHYNTTITTVYQSNTLSQYTYKLNIGGYHITEYLHKLIATSSDKQLELPLHITDEIKIKLSAVRYDTSRLSANKSIYNMPDATNILVGQERYNCTEILFNPKLIGMNINGISASLLECIKSLPDDIRVDMCKCVCVIGGTSETSGLIERLKQDIKQQSDMYVNIISNNNRDITAWLGGRSLVQTTQFQSQWITQKEYDEYGPQIVLRKCF